MIEVIIDRWTKAGTTDFLWSVWRDGQRVFQGDAHNTESAARDAAVSFCRGQLGSEPDRITPL